MKRGLKRFLNNDYADLKKITQMSFPVSSTGQALLEFIPAKAGTGMTGNELLFYATQRENGFSYWCRKKYGENHCS